ncbi:hypothetical protein B0F88_10182 [Methylobacter tundripaludum]|uniref:Uncharacterized protein n=1 Tax=Methylobacter tundripaludum TaxID=173365 RepID=A0A2S6H7U4_9GAMM|nr:hypothetical protein B0F88_10182 [Methylobacter tundripaludum]
MNGNILIPFVVSLSNHEWNQYVQRFLRTMIEKQAVDCAAYFKPFEWAL